LSEPSNHYRQEVTGVLTGCATGLVALEGHNGLTLAGAPLLDPYSPLCPDDVPCRVQDPDLWFAETPADLELAKSYCQDCPARIACLAGALERHEPWGVWGGEIFERGRIIARKRPRGRPRKADREVAA
jgi:WhiB family transcriptional regulator, redox-sensing transcriptional regulator